MTNNEILEFILSHDHDDVNRLALQHKLYSQFNKEEWSFALQQIEGRQKAKNKLPAFYQNNAIIYPRRLSMEQCSSESTAQYKQQLISQQTGSFADLTGGFGVDTFYLSKLFKTAHYIEQDSDLCAIAEHNFKVLNANIAVHNLSAFDFLSSTDHIDCIYIDPARRNKAGSKVFRIEDCEPNLIELWDLINSKSTCKMIKLSPMIDIKEIINSPIAPQQIHIIAVNNECKEIIAICADKQHETTLTATNLSSSKTETMSFTLAQEATAVPIFATKIKQYLYEPNTALLKAGAYKLISQIYRIEKLAPNSHIYTSDILYPDFNGRIWIVEQMPENLSAANVIVRNYPLTAEKLKKKLHLKDGGNNYIIGTTLGNKHITIFGKRIDL